MSDSKDNKKLKWYDNLKYVLPLILSTWILLGMTWLFFASKVACWIGYENPGNIGDTFNVISSLITALAFGAIVVQINVQRKDIEVTQEEIVKQQEYIDRQIHALNLERQERNFFNLMEIYEKRINTLVFTDQSSLDGLRKFMSEKYNEHVSKVSKGEESKSFQDFFSGSHFPEKIASAKSVFRKIIDYLDSSDLKEGDKISYMEMFTSQVSDVERIFYRLAFWSDAKFQNLVMKYNLNVVQNEREWKVYGLYA